MSFGICWKAYRSTPSKGNGFGREQNVQREKNGLISINPFSASRKCARNSPAARSRSSYLTGSIWATIRKTTPRPSLTNSTSSLSGGLPTIAERQKPQKNTRELVTLETADLGAYTRAKPSPKVGQIHPKTYSAPTCAERMNIQSCIAEELVLGLTGYTSVRSNC